MSTPPLFFVTMLPHDDLIELTGDEGWHAATVKRLGRGEPVLIGNGTGVLLDCIVAEVRPDSLLLSVVGGQKIPRPEPAIVVVQALPKGERAGLAVEIMTELGVDEIVPWAAAHSITQWRGPRRETAVRKWDRISVEAAKQSRRAWCPIVNNLATTQAVAARLRESTGLVLHESASTPLASCALPDSGEVVIVVGPEGGIGEAELELFVEAGAQPVRLGREVLRTSTAGAAALAVLSERLGRWA